MTDGTHRIKLVQSLLKIPETGIFDERTEAAVRKFQLDKRLKLDPRYEQFGQVGAVTWKALMRSESVIPGLEKRGGFKGSPIGSKDEE